MNEDQSRTVYDQAIDISRSPLEARRQRLLELRSAIQSGSYRVTSDELAVTLIRSMVWVPSAR